MGGTLYGSVAFRLAARLRIDGNAGLPLHGRRVRHLTGVDLGHLAHEFLLSLRRAHLPGDRESRQSLCDHVGRTRRAEDPAPGQSAAAGLGGARILPLHRRHRPDSPPSGTGSHAGASLRISGKLFRRHPRSRLGSHSALLAENSGRIPLERLLLRHGQHPARLRRLERSPLVRRRRPAGACRPLHRRTRRSHRQRTIEEEISTGIRAENGTSSTLLGSGDRRLSGQTGRRLLPGAHPGDLLAAGRKHGHRGTGAADRRSSDKSGGAWRNLSLPDREPQRSGLHAGWLLLAGRCLGAAGLRRLGRTPELQLRRRGAPPDGKTAHPHGQNLARIHPPTPFGNATSRICPNPPSTAREESAVPTSAAGPRSGRSPC